MCEHVCAQTSCLCVSLWVYLALGLHLFISLFTESSSVPGMVLSAGQCKGKPQACGPIFLELTVLWRGRHTHNDTL